LDWIAVVIGMRRLDYDDIEQPDHSAGANVVLDRQGQYPPVRPKHRRALPVADAGDLAKRNPSKGKAEDGGEYLKRQPINR
jgi:hypothetical protein